MRTKRGYSLVLLAFLSWPAGAEDAVTGVATMRDAVTLAIDGARFRLEGIEPPAQMAVCGERPCPEAATIELARFVSGHQVTCTKTRRLGHGFFLSSCRLENGVDVAEHLLGEGLADLGADATPTHQAAAEQAKAARKGLWVGS